MQNQHKNHTVDILNCLANLSSDEIFTPPEIVNQMLDMLPQAVFQSTETTFLDPCTKSGVFLREITKRLLKAQIPMYEDVTSDIRRRCMGAIQAAVNDGRLDRNDPDFTEKAKAIGDTAKNEQDIRFERHLQEVLNHILTKQVFGIAITELTAELSRRSLYCSKNACGQYSICSAFGTNSAGNIRFKPMGHTWVKPNGQPVDEHDLNDSETAKKNWHCKYCGASYESLGQDRDGLESHAYEFIHTDEPERIWGNMEFTVICGNPPYMLADGGSGTGISAMPIYHKFVEQAKRLDPRYLVMIIPSRWFAGGKGLDAFRNTMLHDKHLTHLVDFPKSRDCFPGVDIAGGVCYFLRERDKTTDKCIVSNVNGAQVNSVERSLSQFSVFIRDNLGLQIIDKVEQRSSDMMNNIVLPRNPFGFVSSDRGSLTPKKADIELKSSDGISFISRTSASKNQNLIDKYKVIIGKVNPDRGGVNSSAQSNVITKVNILPCASVCTETYLVLDSFDTRKEADNCASYFRCKLPRFLTLQTITSMNLTRENFQFVPDQDFSHPWTDEMLYKKYDLTQDEIDFIEKTIKPME